MSRHAFEGAHGLGFIIQSRPSAEGFQPGQQGYVNPKTEATRQKLRAGSTGKKMSPETRAKVSATLRARQQRNAA